MKTAGFAYIDDKSIKKLDKDVKRALRITAGKMQDIIREAQVIPRDLGSLQGEKFFIDDSNINNGEVELVNEGPYARRLYYHPEYNFQTESWVDENGVQHGGNLNAQGLWFSLWQEGGYYEDEPKEVFAEVLEAIIGGKL